MCNQIVPKIQNIPTRVRLSWYEQEKKKKGTKRGKERWHNITLTLSHCLSFSEILDAEAELINHSFDIAFINFLVQIFITMFSNFVTAMSSYFFTWIVEYFYIYK